MLCVWTGKVQIFDDNLQFDETKARTRYPNGVGQVARPSDRKGRCRRALRVCAMLARRSRWSMPCSIGRSTTRGWASPCCSMRKACTAMRPRTPRSFPQAIGLASSWDPDLVRQVDTIVAREIRARGVSLVLSPVVDVARDPRWGRIEETFGEDPYLVSRDGRRRHRRPAGRRAAARRWKGLRHAQALDRPWPARKRHECGTRGNLGAHPPREFLPAVRSCRARRRMCARSWPPTTRSTACRATPMPGCCKTFCAANGVSTALSSAIITASSSWSTCITSSRTTPMPAIRALAAGVDMDLPDGQAYATLVASGARRPASKIAAIDAGGAPHSDAQIPGRPVRAPLRRRRGRRCADRQCRSARLAGQKAARARRGAAQE